MIHNWRINDVPIEANVTCAHPDLKGNNCPTRLGDCSSCKYCQVSVKAPDFFTVMDSLVAAVMIGGKDDNKRKDGD